MQYMGLIATGVVAPSSTEHRLCQGQSTTEEQPPMCSTYMGLAVHGTERQHQAALDMDGSPQLKENNTGV